VSRECVICGNRGDVRLGLVEWREPVEGETWTSLPRCVDRQACRDRLEALGELWDLVDRTTGRVVVVVELPPDPEPATEVPSWL